MSASTTDTPEVDVSVVLPVHNEVGHVEEEIARIRAALDASPYSYELIVIDDASTDGSSEVLERIGGIRLVHNRRNLGSGGARRVGSSLAQGRVVVWTDVDMTYPNDQIPWLVDQMDGYDQVVGARTSEEGTHKFARVPAKWFIRRLAQFLTKTEIPDLNSGFRAFRRDVGEQYLHLLPAGFSCVTTITLSFLSGGYSVGYVPITYRERAGESKFHPYHDTKRYLLQVVRMVLSYNPLRFFLPIALVLGLFGTGKLVWDLIDKDFRLATNTLLILFAAFQILGIGLLADLMVRVTSPRDRVPPSGIRIRGLIPEDASAATSAAADDR